MKRFLLLIAAVAAVTSAQADSLSPHVWVAPIENGNCHVHVRFPDRRVEWKTVRVTDGRVQSFDFAVEEWTSCWTDPTPITAAG